MNRTALVLALALASPALAQQAHDHAKHLKEGSELTPEERAHAGTASKLTDDLLRRLAVLLRERMASDPEKALAKAKLGRKQAEELLAFASDYYLARRTALRYAREREGVRARIAKAREAGQPATPAELSAETVLSRQLDEHEIYRGRFDKKFGAKSRALLDAREAEFVAILDAEDARRQQAERGLKQTAADGLDADRLDRFATLLEELKKADAPLGAGEALKRAGLSLQQALGLALLASEYYQRKHAADADLAKLAEAREALGRKKKQGASTAFEERLVKHWEEMDRAFAAFRAEFAGRHGETATGALDARAGRFLEIFARGYDNPLSGLTR